MYVFLPSTNNKYCLNALIKEELRMPYHKNKQQAFQAAQKGYNEAVEANNAIVSDSSAYGTQLKHLKEEVNEAYQQIENALEVSSEHQRHQLEQYRDDLQQIVEQVNEE
jgi:DNA repair exonuclease SbcCD ATPase subunit